MQSLCSKQSRHLHYFKYEVQVMNWAVMRILFDSDEL